VSHVAFKFPAEHFIYTHQYEGEIQVHHESDSGSKAIVSFMIKLDDEAKQNKFINQLDLASWKMEQGE